MGCSNWSAIALGVRGVLAADNAAQTGTAPPPSSYDAVTDRGPRVEPSLPAIGGAGYGFVDAVFGTPIRRLTDGATRPGQLNRSYRTPSGTHQNAWSAGGSFFGGTSQDRHFYLTVFEKANPSARRLLDTRRSNGHDTYGYGVRVNQDCCTETAWDAAQWQLR